MDDAFLLDILHELHESKGYIDSGDLKRVASRFGMSMGRLFSEISWYDAFRTTKPGAVTLRICDGTVCHAKGNDSLLAEIERILGIQNGETTADGKFSLHSVSCLGACEHAPVMASGRKILRTEGVGPAEVMESATASGGGLPDVSGVMRVLDSGFKPVLLKDLPTFSGYIAQGGFEGLKRAVSLPARLHVLREVETSGLRGRSGSAFPVGLKWKSAFNAPGRVENYVDKYIVVNGDEGDPGAFMDRWLMEHNPYAVLEGVLIAAYAVRATRGFLYIRHEYPAAAAAMSRAVEELRAQGLLGENILGGAFSFECSVVRAAESYLCGEESALMESIEGCPGIPRLRPPFPTSRGLYNQPTIINNVETFANIPVILRDGGDAYAGTGKPGCPGTKLISLSGSVRNTGLIEIPTGAISLRELLETCGGGMSEGKRFKCLQVGGPLGCVITEDGLDTLIDFDSIRAIGGVLGSGGVIVMDDSMCAVATAKHLVSFLMAESCGVCTPCREGLRCAHHILSRISSGQGAMEDFPLLDRLLETASLASRCAFGRGFALPLAGGLKAFRREYEEHVQAGICRSGRCDMGKKDTRGEGGNSCA